MADKAKQKAAAPKAAEPKKDGEFDPNADLSKMSLPEQLQWNKKKMAWRAEQKEKAAAAAPKAAAGGDDDFDPNANLSKMTLPE